MAEEGQESFLTINVLPISAVQWFVPRLAKFRQQYPQIQVHVVTSPDPADFRSDIDLAIRVGRCNMTGLPDDFPSNLVLGNDLSDVAVEVLMPDRATPVCSPHLVTQKRPLRAPQDIRQHTLLHTATRPNAWHDWLVSAGIDKSAAKGGLYFDHFLMAAKAAIDQKGIACMPRIVVEEHIAAGRLVAPLECFGRPTGVYYLLCKRSRAEALSVATFRRWLYAEIAPYRDETEFSGKRQITEIAPLAEIH